jgi:hypothetical protein
VSRGHPGRAGDRKANRRRGRRALAVETGRRWLETNQDRRTLQMPRGSTPSWSCHHPRKPRNKRGEPCQPKEPNGPSESHFQGKAMSGPRSLTVKPTRVLARDPCCSHEGDHEMRVGTPKRYFVRVDRVKGTRGTKTNVLDLDREAK